MMVQVTNSVEWLGHLDRLAKLADRGIERPQNEHATRNSKSIARKRQEFVKPILDEKGWSVDDWAGEAGVAYHTASDYLNGKRTPFRYTMAKLAKALGVSVKFLP